MENQENEQKSNASDEEAVDTSGTDGMGEESGIRIMIDSGHQIHSDYTKEQKGPDTDIVGTKVSQGTRGTFTGLWEYELNLIVGLKLSEILVSGNASPTERYWYRNLKREPDIKNNGSGYSLKEPWLKDLGERLSDYIRDYKN